MYNLIFWWLSITLVFFSAGYHMDYQITYPHKGFKTVKLKGVIRKLFIFKNKDRVMKVSLVLQILGYILFIIGLCMNVVAFPLSQVERLEIAEFLFYIWLVADVILITYTLIVFGLYKLLNYKEQAKRQRKNNRRK